jgi:hypothetical protein
MSNVVSEQLRKEIDTYLINNPVDRNQDHPYAPVALKFGVEPEYVRIRFRELRRKGSIVSKEAVENIVEKVANKLEKSHYKELENGDASFEVVTPIRIKSKEEAIKAFQIDTKAWVITGFEVTAWEVGRKNKKTNLTWTAGAADGSVHDKGNFVTETLYRVNLKLSPRKIGNDIGLQKEAVIAELKAYSPIIKNNFNIEPEQRTCLLEIATFDLHLGSLSWGKESGENYDIEIAERRFKKSVQDLLKRVNLSQVERILFPIGNDLMNIDNKNNMTVNGTVVDTDVRFIKMLKVARRIMIETIDELSMIAPVDVVVVPGNHDGTVSLVLGEILDAWYHNNEKVTINNSPRTRKYYEYGIVGIQFTHGDNEAHHDLGLIFANEQKDLWARTSQRFAQLGHFHKNKKINYVSVDEFQGFQVQILPTLSSATAWADKKGYSSLKQAKAFLFDRVDGLIGEFTTTA